MDYLLLMRSLETKIPRLFRNPTQIFTWAPAHFFTDSRRNVVRMFYHKYSSCRPVVVYAPIISLATVRISMTYSALVGGVHPIRRGSGPSDEFGYEFAIFSMDQMVSDGLCVSRIRFISCWNFWCRGWRPHFYALVASTWRALRFTGSYLCDGVSD